MTVRDRMRVCSGPIQVVIQAWMVKRSLDEPGSDYESLASLAFEAWDDMLRDARQVKPEITEVALAEELVAGLRKQEVWGKILRGNAS